ncbi:MAG: DUF2971 domain-containing protein [Lachnospiraceae bacterium]|nr:DUF2971 domain-containing protein [Lachnospiraceae bacterium]
MVSDQEKIKFLQEIIGQMGQQENEQLIRKAIHKLLMADTVRGKLYKYRAFNEYSLDNLKTQTLHGSKPSAFNDPFDSKIGVDIYSLVESRYNIEFNVIEKIFYEFIEVYSGKKSMDNCSESNKIIFGRLLNSNNFMGYFASCFGNTSLTDEEIEEHLINHTDILVEMISSILVDEETRKKLKYTETIIPELDKKEIVKDAIAFYEREKSLKSIIHSMGIDDDVDEISLVKLLYIQQQPDEYEKAIKMDQLFTEIEKKVNRAIDDMVYIVSLCTDHKNRLMWSHYADNHKGFCIEYDFGADLLKDDGTIVLPVVYSSMRPKLPYENVLLLEEPTIKNVNSQNLYESILFSMLTKDEIWSYEREWRILFSAQEEPMNIPAPPISCIYLGTCCSEENEEKIKALAQDRNIPVKKMIVDRGDYSLHVE